MAQNCFHPSIEGAQHGAKSLAQFLDYAKKSGASGAQPSNYMLQSDKGFKSAREIKDAFAKAKMKWDEDYLLRFLDLCAELEVKIVPMFWGVAFGWELATGYPWGFWQGGDYDLLKEGKNRFVKKTSRIRQHAKSLGIFLCHEIHPGTAAMCADDFNILTEICDGDKCLAVNADPSHCWEGESWEMRFLKVAPRIYAG